MNPPTNPGDPAKVALFSDGTLPLEPVQLATFGRTFEGRPARLPGCQPADLRIEDLGVVAVNGPAEHRIVPFTCNPADEVEGAVLSLTPSELAKADRYEVAAYRRIALTLLSDARAWVCADAPQGRPAR